MMMRTHPTKTVMMQTLATIERAIMSSNTTVLKKLSWKMNTPHQFK